VISCSTGTITERLRTGTIRWISRTALFGEHSHTAGIISHGRTAIITCSLPLPVTIYLLATEAGEILTTEDDKSLEVE
jgi:hypothetical protein